MRTPRTYRRLERAFRLGKEKKGFRLLGFSVLSNHLHLIVEADHKRKLARGMQGLTIRIAKALNKHWHRKGAIFAERYHLRVIERTMSSIKRAIRYVLQNARKHGIPISARECDPFSSGRWFNWHQRDQMKRPLRSPPVMRATCQFTEACFRIGLDIDDLPGRRFWAPII